MNVVVIGAEGQLGAEVMRTGKSLGWLMVPVGHVEGDLRWKISVEDYASCRKVVGDIDRDEAPISAVVNCAAYHNMPLCAKYPRLAWDINTGGPANLAKALNLRRQLEDVLLIQVSTDCVFGEDRAPLYQETSMRVPFTGGDDKGIYGNTKLAGELAVQSFAHRYAIVRVATLFGVAGCRARAGGNLIDSLVERVRDKKPLVMHTNTKVSVTYAVDAARAICRTIDEMAITMEHARVVHACNDTGIGASHYEIARAVCDGLGLVETKDYVIEEAAAPRAKRMPLAPTYEMPDWKRAIRAYLVEKGYLTEL